MLNWATNKSVHHIPADMLGHRLLRWPNINPALIHRLVVAGMLPEGDSAPPSGRQHRSGLFYPANYRGPPEISNMYYIRVTFPFRCLCADRNSFYTCQKRSSGKSQEARGDGGGSL